MKLSKCLILLVLWMFTYSGNLLAQNPTDTIKFKSFNSTLLQQLVESGVNKQRKAVPVAELQQNNALKLAAQDQLAYIQKLGKLVHDQTDPNKASVKLRVAHYGGGMRGTGENAAGFTILKPARFPLSEGKDTVMTIYTYQQAADMVVNMWYLSPTHKKNMLYPSFTHGGLAIGVDASRSMMYGIHVLGF